ncbi:tellurite resistance TerB family protein [Marinobacterium lutimaris]|uniref:Uncharacterized conserved protein, tellurite resistance protein B (TerB) family n=1 Tax=Marinobacterium lutimaris TaxID=568106 RepID=A0A1H6DI79_9GAMM|nr:TerB family tellurite resistance protein [Marinobacterium lutimaris]SEG84914.1 Uncharacterized conserved protein, tellurite resistance protein B (TerB) family [Marinobacterium lutimaris]
MFNKIKAALEDLFETDRVAGAEDSQETFALTAAALMVEVIAADYERKPEEREALLAVVRDSFGLDPAAAEALLEKAEEKHQQSTDYFRFTSEINRICSQEEKVRLIENLWRVAYSDGELQDVEDHVIRRIADLIHVPHMEFIAAKHRVQPS